VSRFITRLALEDTDTVDGGQWVLTRPLVYESELLNAILTVPDGFETDLASVPRLPVVYTLVGDTARAAAVVHDFLYGRPDICTRKIADSVLQEACGASGVSAWRSWLMWAGVRLGGSGHYSKRTAQ
jgi:hypothetical protein